MQLAKLLGDIATGQVKDETIPSASEAVRQYMSALGKVGGPKGGAARAISLSATKRSQIALKAARARWSKRSDSDGK